MRGGIIDFIIVLAAFGAVHAIAYTLIGFSLAFTIFVNWTARQWKIKADMIRIYRGILEERLAKRERD